MLTPLPTRAQLLGRSLRSQPHNTRVNPQPSPPPSKPFRSAAIPRTPRPLHRRRISLQHPIKLIATLLSTNCTNHLLTTARFFGSCCRVSFPSRDNLPTRRLRVYNIRARILLASRSKVHRLRFNDTCRSSSLIPCFIH